MRWLHALVWMMHVRSPHRSARLVIWHALLEAVLCYISNIVFDTLTDQRRHRTMLNARLELAGGCGNCLCLGCALKSTSSYHVLPTPFKKVLFRKY